MARRKSGGPAAIALFLLIAVIVMAAPYLALLLAAMLIVGGIVLVIRILRGAAGQSSSGHAGNQFSYSVIVSAESAIRQLQRPGRVQTRLDRVGEASSLLTSLKREAQQSGIEPAASPMPQLQAAIDAVYASVGRELKSYYGQEAAKLQTASVRQGAKIASRALESLSDLQVSHPALAPISAHYGPVFSRITEKARHADEFKAKMAEAKALEADNKHAALDRYLSLLYLLRTDDIDDFEQESQITDVENRVRLLVRSFARSVGKI